MSMYFLSPVFYNIFYAIFHTLSSQDLLFLNGFLVRKEKAIFLLLADASEHAGK